MEKQEMETGNWKWKLEMETGNGMEIGNGNWKWNGNWKRKWEQKKRTNHWGNVFFIVCLVITLACILLSNGYRTGFMSRALPLLLYCAL